MSSRPRCARCEKTFPNIRAKKQHLDDSDSHNACPVCSFDGLTWDDLVQHYHDTRHRIICEGCDEGKGWWIPGSQEYLDHLRTENVCTTCGRHFDSPSNLKHHTSVHPKPSVMCYGCRRWFTIYADMILHLDSGTCDSGIGPLDLNRSAAMCSFWRKFVVKEHREDLLHFGELQFDEDDEDDDDEPARPFFCPVCKTPVPKLSALFQHVKSTSCEEERNGHVIKKLRRWLRTNHSSS